MDRQPPASLRAPRSGMAARQPPAFPASRPPKEKPIPAARQISRPAFRLPCLSHSFLCVVRVSPYRSAWFPPNLKSFFFFSFVYACKYRRIVLSLWRTNKQTNMRLTSDQVAAQQIRFDKFLATVNLAKLGKKYYYFMAADNSDGRYNSYCYILRVLRLCANVEGCMYHPEFLAFNRFYNEILRAAALSAFLDSLKK